MLKSVALKEEYTSMNSLSDFRCITVRGRVRAMYTQPDQKHSKLDLVISKTEYDKIQPEIDQLMASALGERLKLRSKKVKLVNPLSYMSEHGKGLLRVKATKTTADWVDQYGQPVDELTEGHTIEATVALTAFASREIYGVISNIKSITVLK